MAIQKSKSLPSGISGNYWKITTITADAMNLTITARISLFLDVDHSNIAPLPYSKLYVITIDKTQLAANIPAMAYASIMAQANTMVPPLGDPNGDKVPFDPDLAGGTPV